MDSELYLDRDSFFHRLDPRTKILILAAAFLVVLLFEHPLWVLPITLLIVLHGLMAGVLVNLRRIRTIMVVLTLFSLVLWNLFSNGITPFFWFVEVESLLFSLDRVLMMLSLVTAGMIFLSTTRMEEFVSGMICLGLPYRVGFAISTSFRMVPTIFSSLHIIAQAQRSRGLNLDDGSPVERLRKYLPLLVPVFISTIRGTNVFGMALESKGFGARARRTFYFQSKFKTADYLMVAFLIILLVGASLLRFAGYGMIQGLIRF